MNRTINKKFLIFGSFLTFLASIYFAFYMNMDCAPDEYMRYIIPEWIYYHRTLPIGNEIELINPIWGISYGFTPYFPQLISVFFMRLFSPYITHNSMLLFFARIPSAMAYSGLFICSYYIGYEVNDRKNGPELMAISMISIPQVFFLSTYINNDLPALFFTALFVYLCILGYKYDFDYKKCFWLGSVVGLVFITYYSAVSLILSFGILFLYCVFIKEDNDKKQIILKIFIAALAIIIVSGWHFLRNAIIYDGDILGLKAMKICQEYYADSVHKPSNVYNGINSELTFKEYFMPNGFWGDDSWFKLSYRSFLGMFGYLKFGLSRKIYALYTLFFLIGIIGVILQYFDSKEMINRNKSIISIVFVMSILLPWLFSLYNSYFNNYQAQGRYAIYSLIPLMICSINGCDYIYYKIKTRFNIKISSNLKLLSFNKILLALFLVLLVYSIITVIIPNCMNSNWKLTIN